MITALLNNQRVFAEKMTVRTEKYVCPFCKERMILVKPELTIIDHFRHKVECVYNSEPETQQHLEGKKFLYDFFKDYCDCGLEVKLGNRIADVVLINGRRRVALEYQCSPISMREYLDRTKDYDEMGVRVVWVWGGANGVSFDKKIKDLTDTTLYYEKYDSADNVFFYVSHLQGNCVVEIKSLSQIKRYIMCGGSIGSRYKNRCKPICEAVETSYFFKEIDRLFTRRPFFFPGLKGNYTHSIDEIERYENRQMVKRRLSNIAVQNRPNIVSSSPAELLSPHSRSQVKKSIIVNLHRLVDGIKKENPTETVYVNEQEGCIVWPSDRVQK